MTQENDVEVNLWIPIPAQVFYSTPVTLLIEEIPKEHPYVAARFKISWHPAVATKRELKKLGTHREYKLQATALIREPLNVMANKLRDMAQWLTMKACELDG